VIIGGGNIFFNENSDISAVFDFEKTYSGPRERELARAVFLTCLNGSTTQHDIDRARYFVAAYNEYYPISEQALRSAMEAHIIRYFHSTWIEEEHYLHGNSRLDEIYPKVAHNTTYFAKHHKDLIDRLTLNPHRH
jgi:Ser/Thr protein kinase RdoA (MazF antagonist)